jgi:hypothetical protein
MISGFSCKKQNKGDAGGSNQVIGNVFSVNTFEGDGLPQTVGNINLFIRYLPKSPDSIQFDTAYYLYSVPSGPSGIFTFTNLNSDSSYQIFAMTSIMDSSGQDILFSGHYTITPKPTYPEEYDAQLELTVDQQAQNGIQIVAKDVNGATLSGCTVCFFTSQIVATDTLCQYASFVMTSDSYGRVLKVDLIANTTFYVDATLGADTTGAPIFLKDIAQPVTVKPAGIAPLPMTLN